LATILIFLSKLKEINYIRYASYYCININNKFSASDTFFWVYTVGDDYNIDIFLGETDCGYMCRSLPPDSQAPEVGEKWLRADSEYKTLVNEDSLDFAKESNIVKIMNITP